MHIFFLLFLFLIPINAIAEDQVALPKTIETYQKNLQDQVMRSQLTAQMFTQGCFHLFWDSAKQQEWIQQNFSPLTAEESAPYLKSAGAKEGIAWWTSTVDISTGRTAEMAIIPESKQKCHVVAYGTEEKSLHVAIKKFSEEAIKNMPEYNVHYGYKEKSENNPYNQSILSIRHKENEGYILFVVDSMPGGLNDQTAIMTFKTNYLPD